MDLNGLGVGGLGTGAKVTKNFIRNHILSKFSSGITPKVCSGIHRVILTRVWYIFINHYKSYLVYFYKSLHIFVLNCYKDLFYITFLWLYRLCAGVEF